MIVFSLEIITPAKAAEYLTHNTGNRNLRVKASQKIARDIVTGKWQLTHQAIAFDRNGRLIDGQHRLSAIIIANMPVEMYVARYDAVMGDTLAIPIDEGLKRATYELLHLDKRVTSICTALVRCKSLGQRDCFSMAEIKDMADRHGALVLRLLEMVSQATKKVRTTAPVIAGVAIVILEHPEQAEALENQWKHFVTFENLSDLQPSVTAFVRYADGSMLLPHRFEECVCRTVQAFEPGNWKSKLNRIKTLSLDVKEVQKLANRVL
jgi:hypothetical protein